MAYSKRKRKAWQRRYLSQKGKIAIAVAVALAILAGGFALALGNGWITLPKWENPQEDTQPTGPAAPDTVIHMVAGGDVNGVESVISAGSTPGGYDFSQMLLDVTPILAGADLSVVNFEGNLAGAPYGGSNFSAPQELVVGLKNAGVDILQTANSKSIDNGLRGLQATLQGVRGVGLQTLGTYANKAEFESSGGFLLREIDGIKIALVAFTKGMDGRGLPTGSENCVNLLYTDYSSTYQKVDTEGITKVMNTVAVQNPDITIALLHWGSELNAQISKTQTQLVKLFAKLGADAIVGTHSHYVQKMGFDKDTGMFVAYSLGDLLGEGKNSGTDYSVLLDLEITKNGTTGKTSITGFDAVPIYRVAQENGFRMLRMREAIQAYEDRYVDAVPEELYLAMKDALTKIESRIEK